MIRVHRKGYHRRGYNRKGRHISGAYVSPTTYMATDRGKRGRGNPFVAKRMVKSGILGDNFFSKSVNEQKRILTRKAKRLNEKAVQGQLQLVANYNKRINPAISRRAAQLRKYVAGSFKGRKRVRYPGGFR